MASPTLKFKRGLYSQLPTLAVGEPGFTTDRYQLYVGSPAKAARLLTKAEFAFLKRSATHYVKLKDEYIAEQE